jgi:Zn finger protein HypA/HybF involved in hydrogenase expression
MPIVVFVYRCIGDSCRNIQRMAELKQAQVGCPKCGSIMKLIGIERKDET